MSNRTTTILAGMLVIFPTLALAHVGVGATSGMGAGFAHPLTGLDHILAMAGVGMIAAYMGGRALWLLPLSFVAMMAVGGLLGVGGMPLPYFEVGIATSVIAFGALIAARLSMPLMATMAVVAFFAIFHGHAHGTEMPATAAGLTYGIGFMLATALLHAAGIAVGIGMERMLQATGGRLLRVAGGAMSVVGVIFLVGAI